MFNNDWMYINLHLCPRSLGLLLTFLHPAARGQRHPACLVHNSALYFKKCFRLLSSSFPQHRVAAMV